LLPIVPQRALGRYADFGPAILPEFLAGADVGLKWWNFFQVSISGSAVVLEQLQPMEAPETLDDAAELIQKYLHTCIDNRANYVDCSSFGGNVQIATVT
jgi:hypothetical protein